MITLADIQHDGMADLDYNSIDEIRQASPFLLNSLPFQNTVAPTLGGGTLVAGYTRISQLRTAHTRQENTEYPAFEGKRDRKFVELVPMGARYNIDRVHARLGAADEVQFQHGLALRATIAKFHDEFINGVASDFSTDVPGFDGLDALVTGTTTEWYDRSGGGAVPWSFGALTRETAQRADFELRNWMRRMSGLQSGEGTVAFFTNVDGIAFLEQISALLSANTTTRDDFGRDYPTFRGIPYVDLGLKPGATTQDGFITGTEGTEVIPTSADGVTTIYAARLANDSVHGFSMNTGEQGNVPGDGLFSQWLPVFNGEAGAVKPGEVELGPLAIAARSTLSVGAFRVRVR